MNPRLVICLFAALVVGLACGGWCLFSGWHPLLAVAAYSLSASVTLVVLALVAVPQRTPRSSAPAPADALLPAAQRT